jgi:hypothetical protein
LIVGAIRDPVNWDFTIRVCEDDVAGMTKLILRPAMIGMLLRSIFKHSFARKKPGHWTQEYAEHIAEGKERLIAAQEKADVRIRAREEEGGPVRSTTASVR